MVILLSYVHKWKSKWFVVKLVTNQEWKIFQLYYLYLLHQIMGLFLPLKMTVYCSHFCFGILVFFARRNFNSSVPKSHGATSFSSVNPAFESTTASLTRAQRGPAEPRASHTPLPSTTWTSLTMTLELQAASSVANAQTIKKFESPRFHETSSCSC